MKCVAMLLLAVAAMLATTDAKCNVAPAPMSLPQVAADPNAKGRFDVFRPRPGRILRGEVEEARAKPAPRFSFKELQTNGDPNASARFQVYRPRGDGRALKEEDNEAVAAAAPAS